MKQVAATAISNYVGSSITSLSNLTTTGALDSGSITSGFGTINTGSSTITTTGAITGGSLVISDGGNIGSSSDTDAISIASGGNVTMSQNLTVTGDLTVSGTTTTVNSTTVTIDDPVFTIGGDTAPGSDDNKDRGIEFRYHTGSAAKVGFFGFDDSAGKFTFIPDATNNSEVFSGTAGTIVANLEGAVTGNASTATALANARTIAGQSFDGTGNISIAPTDLTGVNSTAAELNIMDGGTSATSTVLADADRVVVNDDGTMVQVALTDFETYFEGALDTLSNVTTVGALNAGSITSGFGSIDNGSSAITTTGTITYGSLSDGAITVTAFVDEDNMASNSATLIPTQQSVKAYVDSVAASANNVTGLNATGEEINAVADVSAITVDTSTAIATADAIAILDASANSGNGGIGYFDVDLLDTYFAGTTKTLTNKTLTSPVVTGLHLNDSGFTVEGSSADDNETTVSFTNPTADRTITIPDATGTVALLSSAQDFTAQQTFSAGMDIDNGQFIGWGAGSSRPAITGDKSSNKMEFYVGGNERLDLTSTDLTSSLTGSFKVPVGTTAQRTGSPANGMFRYNSDDDAFEGYAGGAWGAIGGGGDSQTASTSSTAQTAIATYTASSSLGIEITVVATDTVATERTITKLLVTHDGSTAVATQYGEVNTATAMASYDVDINSGNVRLLATAASSNATNFSVNAVVLA